MTSCLSCLVTGLPVMSAGQSWPAFVLFAAYRFHMYCARHISGWPARCAVPEVANEQQGEDDPRLGATGGSLYSHTFVLRRSRRRFAKFEVGNHSNPALAGLGRRLPRLSKVKVRCPELSDY